MEKQRQTKIGITKLNSNGTIIDDPKMIANICGTFYRSLYESRLSPEEFEHFFNSLTGTKIIGEENKMLCDSPITHNTIKEAIKSLKSNKFPGTDGLT